LKIPGVDALLKIISTFFKIGQSFKKKGHRATHTEKGFAPATDVLWRMDLSAIASLENFRTQPTPSWKRFASVRA
jgi:hypothetical protein